MTAAATSNMIDGYINLVQDRNKVKYLTIFTSREATRHTIIKNLNIFKGN
jgi:hypothetical protein